MSKTIGFAVIAIGAAWCVAVAGCQRATQPATPPSTSPATRDSTLPTAQPSSQSTNELILNLGNQVTMKLVLIPAGKFIMGSPVSEAGHTNEEAQHEVTISKPFYMGIYDVTQEQYAQVMGTNPSRQKAPQNPVETVSWDDAMEFCKKLSTTTGMTITLPTEAQWEYACRAGTTTPFYTGSTISTDDANYDGTTAYGDGKNGVNRRGPVAVGSFKPNAWGLYDMHGNVYQWCLDKHEFVSYVNGKAQPQPSPFGPSFVLRVMRGGSSGASPGNCRSACRSNAGHGNRLALVGFRIVCESAAGAE